jgi:phage terminase large subunit-like protein
VTAIQEPIVDLSKVIYAPGGFPLQKLTAGLSSTALEFSGSYRRNLCRYDPLLFALIYMPHHLRSDETGGKLSFSQFHVDIANAAKRWVRSDFKPGELREAWIAPRGAAKTTWLFLILPLWAMAFGHQRFIMAFSNTSSQAEGHLRTLVDELRSNDRLREDFPDLCSPTVNNAELYMAYTQVGVEPDGKPKMVKVAIRAKGIDSSTLGMKIGNLRPTCILLDEVEPKESSYDSSTKKNRLDAITNAIFPMALNAVVQWAATVTTAGSLAHDLVKAATGQGVAEWVSEQRIRVRYYPAIVTDDDGRIRSLWPQRWSIRYLLKIRGTRTYQLNYANNPVSKDGTYWTPELFMIDKNFRIESGVLSIDPATTSKATSDPTGYAAIAVDYTGQKVCVVSARGVRKTPRELGVMIRETCQRNRWINEVILEGNQGGDTWAEIIRPYLPAGVTLKVYYSHEPKVTRWAAALEHYEAGLVVHARALPIFEEQALGAPNLVHDDVLDAVTAGIRHFLDGKRDTSGR